MPDPPARKGRHITTGDHRRCPLSHRRAGIQATIVSRAMRRGRARRRLAPTRGGGTHLRSGVSGPRLDCRAHPVGVRRCLTRPPGRAGRTRRRPAAVGRDHHRTPVCDPDLPRRAARRARQRLAPTTWGKASPVGHIGITGTRDPRSVGVRRCLTRRPGRAGPGHRGRSTARHSHHDAPDHTVDVPRLRRGRARHRLAPTR